jgi:hypothetical protein
MMCAASVASGCQACLTTSVVQNTILLHRSTQWPPACASFDVNNHVTVEQQPPNNSAGNSHQHNHKQNNTPDSTQTPDSHSTVKHSSVYHKQQQHGCCRTHKPPLPSAQHCLTPACRIEAANSCRNYARQCQQHKPHFRWMHLMWRLAHATAVNTGHHRYQDSSITDARAGTGCWSESTSSSSRTSTADDDLVDGLQSRNTAATQQEGSQHFANTVMPREG